MIPRSGLFAPITPAPVDRTPLRVCQYLHSSCSAMDYGQIIAVGNDENGVDTIDILVRDVQDLIDCDDEFAATSPLTRIELPLGQVILRDVQVQRTDRPDIIVCNTPGNGCFRCTKMFFVRDGAT